MFIKHSCYLLPPGQIAEKSQKRGEVVSSKKSANPCNLHIISILHVYRTWLLLTTSRKLTYTAPPQPGAGSLWQRNCNLWQAPESSLILHRLGQVLDLYGDGAVQVRNSTGQAQDSVVCPGRQIQF